MSRIRNILSLMLVGVLMLSTMSFSIGRHYCMGKMVEQRFNSMAESCGMMVEDSCSDSHNELKANCCESKQIIFDGIDVLSFSKQVIDFDLPLLNKVFHSLSFREFTSALPEINSNSPPYINTGRTILVLLQRFLI